MNRFESKIERLRWLKWQWTVVETTPDGTIVAETSGTIAQAYLAAHIGSTLRDRWALQALIAEKVGEEA